MKAVLVILALLLVAASALNLQTRSAAVARDEAEDEGEAELEVETEVETEDQTEEEGEDEAEDESEEEAEEEGEAEEESENEWDIAEGITGAAAMGKKDGHEQSVKQAYNQLSAADKQQFTNPNVAQGTFAALHTPAPIIMGVQYPDMPIGGRSVAQLGDDLTSPTHVNAVTFGTLFAAGGKGVRNSFVAQTHYGCLQFWHAMAPEPYVGGKYKVWSNANLSQLIKNGAQRIWTVAVNHMKAGRKNMAEFHLGRILHTIGDSYAKGHTKRQGDCGKILVFQEYNAQKGNSAHGSGDKPDSNRPQFRCTVDKIKAVLQAFAGCIRSRGASCAYPAGTINTTFDVDASVASLDAGGSLDFYAGPEAKSKGTKKTVPGAGIVWFPAQKGLQRIAGTSAVAQACPPF